MARQEYRRENIQITPTPSPAPASTPSKPIPSLPKRIVSLDALRGFDLFFLFALGSILSSLLTGPLASLTTKYPFLAQIPPQLNHVPWEGFTAWDLIMPLFMFMAGVTIPFSLARYCSRSGGKFSPRLIFRLARRVILLWVCGMIVQGNLLNLKIEGLRLYSNTLQAIAAGYLIAAICFLCFRRRWQLLTAFLLLAGFWAAMKWGHGQDSYGLCGNGSYQPDLNFAEFIERKVLGRWRDGYDWAAGAFSSGYHYTWVLSTLTFGVTSLLGSIAGGMIKDARDRAYQDFTKGPMYMTFGILLVGGLVLGAAGWFWATLPAESFFYSPLIKHLWTGSMTLFAGGLSFLLLALFYLIYDIWGLPLCATFLRVIGMNSIFCYMFAHIYNLDEISHKFLYGLEQYIGGYYPALRTFCGFCVLWFIMFCMYRAKKFIRL